MHEWTCCCDEAANQSAVAYSCNLLNHPNSFHGGMFKLNAKSDADLLLYSLSHFECDSHTVHMLSQWHLLPPLTSTAKVSLFTYVHSSPLSLAAKLHLCGTNHFVILTMAGHFPDRLYVCVCVYIYILIIFKLDNVHNRYPC